jgi:hypothetical protein
MYEREPQRRYYENGHVSEIKFKREARKEKRATNSQVKNGKGRNIPVHQDSATRIQTFSDKGIGGVEMLQQIFILDVVDLDDHVLEGSEQVLVKGQAKHGENMGDVCVLQSLLPTQCE